MMCEHHTTVQGLLHHTLQASYSIDVQLVPLGQDVPTQSTMCISISIQEREGDTHVRRRMRRRKRKRRRIMSSGRTPLRMEICTQYALQSNAVLRGRRRIIRSTSKCDKITRLCSCVLFWVEQNVIYPVGCANLALSIVYFLSIAVTVFSPDEVLVTYVNNMMMPRLGRQMNMMEAYTIGQGPDLENSIVMPFVVKINPNAIPSV